MIKGANKYHDYNIGDEENDQEGKFLVRGRLHRKVSRRLFALCAGTAIGA